MTTVVFEREEQDLHIPQWVIDHAAFRRWVKSDEFPERLRCAYLDGKLWVDPSMEKANQNFVKSAISSALGLIVSDQKTGIFWNDRMLLTNLEAGLSTEPDGMYVSYESLKSGRAVLEDAEESLEVIGTPDMVLEVISGTSVNKDTLVLRKLYARAGVQEYWLADSRPKHFSFEILHRHGKRYTAAPAERGGWMESKVFGRSFRMLRDTDPVGLPTFRLDVK